MAKKRKARRCNPVAKKAEWGLFGFKTIATLTGVGLTLYLFTRKKKATDLLIAQREAELAAANDPTAVLQKEGIEAGRKTLSSLLNRRQTITDLMNELDER